jgi:hypothetical protein
MIYFLIDHATDDTRVKIGRSKTPEGVLSRLKTHRSSNTRLEFYCAVDGFLEEPKIHDFFAESKIDMGGNGSEETFSLTSKLRDYLEWLGEQPWAACSAEEVLDPWAHFVPDVPRWPWDDYRGGKPPIPGSLLTEWFGPIRGPLTATERGSSYLRTTDDWYTPVQYVNAARTVMGDIELDPATSHYANQTVRARRIYTINDDGLAPSNLWSGNVWMNPPYGSQQVPFLERLVREHKSGNVPQAVACVNGYRYDARWFQPLWEFPICFSAKRVKFLGGAGSGNPKTEDDNSPANGTVFIYMGAHKQRFADEFRRFGHVVTEVSRHRPAA